MVKLTAEIIQQAPQYFNPSKERMLDLRGAKVSMIENLGATLVKWPAFFSVQASLYHASFYLQDQFDCIDFSDNDIRKIDGFPLLYRMKTLLFNNNRIWYGKSIRADQNTFSIPVLLKLI